MSTPPPERPLSASEPLPATAADGAAASSTDPAATRYTRDPHATRYSADPNATRYSDRPADANAATPSAGPSSVSRTGSASRLVVPGYEIVGELGRGGMGVVYLAKNVLMNRQEVLKVANRALLDQRGAAECFLREIRAAAKLSHENVVKAYSALQVGDLLVFAMEYVEGHDLAKVVQQQGPLPVAHACHYVSHAAMGLQHAHEQKMVHRDIKPHNLILSRRGKKHIVKVLDFGLAKAVREGEPVTDLTWEGVMLGTPAYMAPEQAQDAARADIRADIYSLGCTLYFLLTGGPPFTGKSLFAILQAHMSTVAAPLSQVRAGTPADLETVVAKMMAKNPARRYQKPIEVAQALAPFIKGGALPVKPAKAGPPTTPVGAARAEAQKGDRGAPAAPSIFNRSTLIDRSARPTAVKKKPVLLTPWPWILGLGAAVLLVLVGMVVANVRRSAAPPVAVHKPAEPPAENPTPPAEVAVLKPVEPPSENPTPAEPPPVNPPPPANPTPPAPLDQLNPPSVVRAAAGQYVVSTRKEPSILVQRQAGQPSWKRLVPGKSEVFTTDDLVSLPGYNSELDLGADGGTRLVLHGHVPQFTVHPNDIMDFLMDSAVRLHQPEAGFDVDLTLQHGRIYLSNHKADGPVKVRLRFGGDPSKTPAVPQEVWDLTLVDRDTEIGVDLLQAYTGDIDYRDGEAPLQQMFLFVFPPGRAGVRIESREFSNLPAPFAVFWDNKGPGASASAPQPIDPKVMPAIQAVWSKTPPLGATDVEKAATQQMRAALDYLSLLMTEKTIVDAALLAARGTAESPMLRQLAVYAFGALDEPDKVLDVLCYDEDTAHAADRSAAVFTLRRWISRGATNGDLLYDPKKEVGLLKERFHLPLRDAEIILEELHDFPKDEAHKPALFEALTTLLRHRELSVRELAYWHLLKLSVGARVPLPPYNAAASPAEREPAVVAWKELVKNGDLPPPQPTPPK